MSGWKEILALALAWLLIAMLGAIVIAGFRRCVPDGGTALPPQRRRFTAWTGPLVTAAFLVLYFLPAVVQPFVSVAAVAHWAYGPNADAAAGKDIALVIIDLLALPLQIAGWYGLAAVASGGRPTFGIAPKRLAADFVVAFRTWIVITPGVYLVSFIASVVYTVVSGQPPAGHPIARALEHGPVPIGVVVLLFVQAAFGAPIREETFFRGILQPFFAARPWGGDLAVWLALGFGVVIRRPGGVHWTDPADVLSAAAPALLVLAVLPLYWRIESANPFRWLPVRDPATRRQAARAILGTSLLFANFHANIWPTPIPLFFLALGLGWVAYRTQGIAASIFLHVLFNAIFFAALPLQMLLERLG